MPILNSNLINILTTTAEKSAILHQVAAAVLKSGKIMGKPCCNTVRNTCRGLCVGSLHAEAHAMLSFFGKDLSYDKKTWRYCSTKNINTHKFDIIVIQKNKKGNLCSARPCHNCLNMMKAININKVYYSVEPNIIICEKVKNMISINVSYINRRIESSACTTTEYYNILLQKYFPTEIKEHNLDNFINYNLKIVLPNYKIKKYYENKKYYILILNEYNICIIKALIKI